jgi:hypothetical protein
MTVTLRIVWRPTPEGSWYEQDWQAASRAGALRRWRRFWGLRQQDCAIFTATLIQEPSP